MKTRDTQLGIPEVVLKDTKSNIEALSVDSGAIAYATDTGEFGYYTGSAWAWQEGIAGGGGGGARITALANVGISNWYPTVGAWSLCTVASGSNIVGSYYDNGTDRFTPPAGIVMLHAMMSADDALNNRIQFCFSRNGALRAGHCSNAQGVGYNKARTASLIDETDGTYYYEMYGYRDNGFFRSDSQIRMVAFEAT